MKTFAFVVTYNRFDMLRQVIESLRSQTYQLDKIVVVNNSSTDGTEAWLSEQSDLHVIKQANLGGAGGFQTGVKYCYDQGADWIWMMDDDVFPKSECLENMMQYISVSECIHMTRYYSDGVIYKFPIWYYRALPKNQPSRNKIESSEYITCPAGGCFEGMLVSRNVVKKIGYPDARFFMAGDDTVYGMLACAYTQPIVVKSALAVRAQRSDDTGLRPLQIYYTTRNRHLRIEYQKNSNCNYNIPTWKYYLSNLKQIIRLLCSNQPNRFRAIKARFWGVIDNLRKLCGPSHMLHRF